MGFFTIINFLPHSHSTAPPNIDTHLPPGRQTLGLLPFPVTQEGGLIFSTWTFVGRHLLSLLDRLRMQDQIQGVDILDITWKLQNELVGLQRTHSLHCFSESLCRWDALRSHSQLLCDCTVGVYDTNEEFPGPWFTIVCKRIPSNCETEINHGHTSRGFEKDNFTIWDLPENKAFPYCHKVV